MFLMYFLFVWDLMLLIALKWLTFEIKKIWSCSNRIPSNLIRKIDDFHLAILSQSWVRLFRFCFWVILRNIFQGRPVFHLEFYFLYNGLAQRTTLQIKVPMECLLTAPEKSTHRHNWQGSTYDRYLGNPNSGGGQQENLTNLLRRPHSRFSTWEPKRISTASTSVLETFDEIDRASHPLTENEESNIKSFFPSPSLLWFARDEVASVLVPFETAAEDFVYQTTNNRLKSFLIPPIVRKILRCLPLFSCSTDEVLTVYSL